MTPFSMQFHAKNLSTEKVGLNRILPVTDLEEANHTNLVLSRMLTVILLIREINLLFNVNGLCCRARLWSRDVFSISTLIVCRFLKNFVASCLTPFHLLFYFVCDAEIEHFGKQVDGTGKGKSTR